MLLGICVTSRMRNQHAFFREGAIAGRAGIGVVPAVDAHVASEVSRAREGLVAELAAVAESQGAFRTFPECHMARDANDTDRIL